MHRDRWAQHEHRGKQRAEQNKSDDCGRWHGLGSKGSRHCIGAPQSIRTTHAISVMRITAFGLAIP
jgi:hypothetical protein